MKARGVEFTADIAVHGYGLVTYFKPSGGIKVQLYEPRYVKGKSPGSTAKKRSAKKSKTTRSIRSKRSTVQALRKTRGAK